MGGTITMPQRKKYQVRVQLKAWSNAETAIADSAKKIAAMKSAGTPPTNVVSLL